MSDRSNSKIILIVDDSTMFRELEKNILSDLDVRIYEARHGKEALTLARLYKPDLILLDLNMPVMNGFECLHFMQQDEMLRKLSVIIVTTQGRSRDVRYSLKLGAVDFITKPIDAETLKNKVRSVCNIPQSRRTPRITVAERLTILDRENSVSGMIRDVSPHGISFHSPVTFEIGQFVEVSFHLPFEGVHYPVYSFAKLINCTACDGDTIQAADPDLRYYCRLEFVNLRRDILFVLRNMVQSDGKAKASFLFSNPSQRKSDSDDEHVDPKTREIDKELKSLLNENYSSDDVPADFGVKFNSLKEHFHRQQLQFNLIHENHELLLADYLTLSHLYLTLSQLYSQKSVTDVLSMADEILENLVGGEQFIIYCFNGTGERITISRHNSIIDIERDEGVESALKAGQPIFSDNLSNLSPEGTGFLVAMSFSLSADYWGVIYIISLFPHLKKLTALSEKVLSLLTQHFPKALLLAVSIDQDIPRQKNVWEILLKNSVSH